MDIYPEDVPAALNHAEHEYDCAELVFGLVTVKEALPTVLDDDVNVLEKLFVVPLKVIAPEHGSFDQDPFELLKYTDQVTTIEVAVSELVEYDNDMLDITSPP